MDSSTAVSRATLEGSVVHAEDRRTFPFAEIQLYFQGIESPLTVRADREGRLLTTIDVPQDAELTAGFSIDRKFILVRFSADAAPGKPTRIVARPGETLRITAELAEQTAIRGIVVDEKGVPLPGAWIETSWQSPNGDWGQLRTLASETGRFELRTPTRADEVFDPQTSAAISKVRVTLDPRPPRTFDLRKLSEGERTEWRIVLPVGRRLSGRLVDAYGRPLEDVTVAILSAERFAVRVAKTARDGRFTMDHVGDGATTLGAYVVDGDLEARRTIDVSADMNEVVLVASSIDLTEAPGAITVLGLRLVEVDEAMRKTHDLSERARVMVADAGVVGAWFGTMKALTAGTGILMIGNSPVLDIKSLIDLLIDEAEKGELGRSMIRIVTTHEGNKGTFTDAFTLGRRELDRLKQLRATMR